MKRQKLHSNGGGGKNVNMNVEDVLKYPPLGKRVPFTFFIVDGFNYSYSKDNNGNDVNAVYFLSHFHSDHYVGLHRGWKKGVIYATAPTVRLISKNFAGIENDRLKCLPPFGTSIVIHGMKVTAVDANHCPGSAMFLFEALNNNNNNNNNNNSNNNANTTSKSYLHCGDCRMCQKTITSMQVTQQQQQQQQQQHVLKPYLKGEKRLNILYIDDTYLNPKYKFMDQEKAIDLIVNIVQNRFHPRTLFLIGAYSLGCERIQLAVAKKLNALIYVDKSRYETIKCLVPEFLSLDELVAYTTEKSIANIRVVGKHLLGSSFPAYRPNFVFLEEYFEKEKLMSYDRCVAIQPTGWAFSAKSTYIQEKNFKGTIECFGIPYSEHSSFPELQSFVKAMNPLLIVPTVNTKAYLEDYNSKSNNNNNNINHSLMESITMAVKEKLYGVDETAKKKEFINKFFTKPSSSSSSATLIVAKTTTIIEVNKNDDDDDVFELALATMAMPQ